MDTEGGELRDGEAPGTTLDHVRERLSGQSFEDEHGMRSLDHLVGPDDVGVGEALDEAALPSQAPAGGRVVEKVRTKNGLVCDDEAPVASAGGRKGRRDGPDGGP